MTLDAPIWIVFVNDNFHYMDSEKTWRKGEYSDYQTALSVCRQIVDSCLEEYLPECNSADQLYDRYVSFGDDPYIVPDDGEPRFSAWSYARERCDLLFKEEEKGSQNSIGSFLKGLLGLR
jgi:hypothetical protein